MVCHTDRLRDDAVGDGLKWQRCDAIDDQMVWIGQRDDAVVNLMMGWNGHRDHAVGDGLEWADRLSVLALPAARSWETLFHFFIQRSTGQAASC